MKSTFYLITIFCISLLSIHCSEDTVSSVSDEFKDANGNVTVKLVESISVVSAQNSQENKNIMLSYTSDGLLNTITDGIETGIFIYNDNGELINIAGAGVNLSIEKLYESPYDAFETGEVLIYDDNGNPVRIEFYENGYGCYDNEWGIYCYTADIMYDNTHNPYYYTLAAGGLIEVLDDVELNFSINPQIPEIVKSRLLFPVNNPYQITYKNEEGDVIYTININYVYDNKNYPTSATISTVEAGSSESNTFSAIFRYVN